MKTCSLVKFSRRALIGIAISMAISSSVGGVAVAQEKIKWKLHGDQAATLWWSEELDLFAKSVGDETGGTLEVEFYPASSLGVAPGDILAPVASGHIEMAEFVASYVGSEAPYLAVLGLPRIGTSYDHLRRIVDAVRPEMEKKLANDYDLKILGTLVSTPLQLYLGKQKYSDVNSLKGLRIRTLGPDQDLFATALGATPVQVPIGDIVSAVATNRIDGAIVATPFAHTQQFQQFGPTLVSWNALVGPGFLVVGNSKWNELTAELQEELLSSAKTFEDKVWARAAALEAEAQTKAAADGFQIVAPSESDMKALTQAATASWKGWAERNGPIAAQFLEIATTTK